MFAAAWSENCFLLSLEVSEEKTSNRVKCPLGQTESFLQNSITKLSVLFCFCALSLSAVLLAVRALQGARGYWRVQLLLHLSHHHRRPVYQQQPYHDALCFLPGHPAGKVRARCTCTNKTNTT